MPKIYGLLVMQSNGGPQGETQLEGATTIVGRINQLVPADRLEFWENEVGRLSWSMLSGRNRLVLTLQDSPRPDTLDAEHNRIIVHLNAVWLSWILSAPAVPASGHSWMILGRADDAGRPETATAFRAINEIKSPVYQGDMEFARGILHRSVHDWFPRFVAIQHRLARLSGQLPRILDVALVAYHHAMSDQTLDYAIPHFVRAAECLLGLPPGKGSLDFAKRGLRLIPTLRADSYCGGQGVKNRLRRLYWHRNACVHGKIPFEDLIDKGDEGKVEAGKFQYVAEHLAREAILRFLNEDTLLADLSSRETLEEAWETRRIPPPSPPNS